MTILIRVIQKEKSEKLDRIAKEVRLKRFERINSLRAGLIMICKNAIRLLRQP